MFFHDSNSDLEITDGFYLTENQTEILFNWKSSVQGPRKHLTWQNGLCKFHEESFRFHHGRKAWFKRHWSSLHDGESHLKKGSTKPYSLCQLIKIRDCKTLITQTGYLRIVATQSTFKRTQFKKDKASDLLFTLANWERKEAESKACWDDSQRAVPNWECLFVSAIIARFPGNVGWGHGNSNTHITWGMGTCTWKQGEGN